MRENWDTVDVALLTASLTILVWMCAQLALLTRSRRLAADRTRASGSHADAGPARRLPVVDHAPSVDQ